MSAIQHGHHGTHHHGHASSHANPTPVKMGETSLASQLAGMGLSPQQIETILAQINGTKAPAPTPTYPPAPQPLPSGVNANQAALFQMQSQDMLQQQQMYSYYQGMMQMEQLAVAQAGPSYNASSAWGAWGAAYQGLR